MFIFLFRMYIVHIFPNDPFYPNPREAFDHISTHFQTSSGKVGTVYPTLPYYEQKKTAPGQKV